MFLPAMMLHAETSEGHNMARALNQQYHIFLF
jgi:hypothetical protein